MESLVIQDIEYFIKTGMKQRFAENVQIDVAAELRDLACVIIDFGKRHKRIAFVVAAEGTVQIAGIGDFQINTFHESILSHFQLFVNSDLYCKISFFMYNNKL